jgi:predicted dehydrogenase
VVSIVTPVDLHHPMMMAALDRLTPNHRSD